MAGHLAISDDRQRLGDTQDAIAPRMRRFLPIRTELRQEPPDQVIRLVDAGIPGIRTCTRSTAPHPKPCIRKRMFHTITGPLPALESTIDSAEAAGGPRRPRSSEQGRRGPPASGR